MPFIYIIKISICIPFELTYGNKYYNITSNYTNTGYGLSLVDTLWNAGFYRQPLEQEGNPMI